MPRDHDWVTVALGSVVHCVTSANSEDARLMKEKSARNASPPAITSGVKKRYG